MKYIGIVTLVLASSILTAVISTYVSQEKSSHSITSRTNNNDKIDNPHNKNKLLLDSISADIQELKILLHTNTTKNSKDKKKPPLKKSKKPSIDKLTFNDNLDKILDNLQNNQSTLLQEFRTSETTNTTKIEKIFKEQKVSIKTIRDLQWESTPRTIIDLKSLSDLNDNVFSNDRDHLIDLLGSFPLQINLVTNNLKVTASDWGHPEQKNWKMLTSPTKGGGVFHLHVSAKDFINHKNDNGVKHFLRDIRGRSQIILYHSDWKSFIDLFQTSTNAKYFQLFKGMIRLDVGGHYNALINCNSAKTRIAFLKSVRYKYKK